MVIMFIFLADVSSSRLLGHKLAHACGVIASPMCTRWRLTPQDEFLVLGSEGLWQIMTNDQMVDFVQQYRRSSLPGDTGLSVSDALTLEAQERYKLVHGDSNVPCMSAVVVLLVDGGLSKEGGCCGVPSSHGGLNGGKLQNRR